MQKCLPVKFALGVALLLNHSAFGGVAEDKTSSDPLTTLAPINQRGNKVALAPPKLVTLRGGIQVHTLVLLQTRWEPKSMPQSAIASAERERKLMHLPEAERLKEMNRIDNYTQLWWIRLADFPSAGGEVKELLRPEPLSHEAHCELAFLGKSDGFAWFGHMPMYEWISLQRELHLQGGDDPLEGAARGLAIEDHGSVMANSAESFLVQAGANALPYLKPVLTGTNAFQRALSVLSQIPGSEATTLLLGYAESSNPAIARRTRYLMAWYPRPDAEDAYFKWLNADVGRTNVFQLLQACAKCNLKRLAPFLPRVLAAPKSVHEYRRAFELARTAAGKEIPRSLLDAEESIKKYGYRSGTNFDQGKVVAAVNTLLRANDIDSAACIGLSLACATTKGDWSAANQAGLTVLKDLPKQRGRELAKTAYQSLEDEWIRQKLAPLVP
jgi:hypothetical protein